MSAYFESLNRRVATAVRPHPAPRRAPLARLAPGAVPSAYAVLRERLLAAASAATLHTLVFAGCDGGEGCTQVVREFAEALASMGLRVLLVDADMRTAGLTTTLAPRGSDLAELADAGRDPEDAAWGNGSLAIVPSPVGVGDKENFLRSATLASWLTTQAGRYDYVLLDAPPLERFADALLISARGDGVVLVAEPGRTRMASVLRAQERLARVGARLLGVVVNRAVHPVPAALRGFFREI